VKKQSGNTPGSLVNIKGADYRLERAAPGLDRWACTLTKLDGPRKGSQYRVALDHRGRWRCQCEAYRFCRSPDGRWPHEHFCKHADFVSGLAKLSEIFIGVGNG
jgi:hypothetical protein